MDYQLLFNVVFGLLASVLMFLLNNMWQELKDQRKINFQINSRVGNMEVLVAGHYITRQEFSSHMDKLFKELGEINKSISAKADR